MLKKLRGKFFLIILLGLLWLWLRRQQSEESGKVGSIEIPVETSKIVLPAEEQPSMPVSKIEPVTATVKTVARKKKSAAKPDDLTVINGIGPKISAVLNAAGITRYNQLAKADAAQLWEILEKASIRLAKPESWIEQAKTLHKE
jgi:predicted flap endonuclease-1-like 5' DNA nuclease